MPYCNYVYACRADRGTSQAPRRNHTSANGLTLPIKQQIYDRTITPMEHAAT